MVVTHALKTLPVTLCSIARSQGFESSNVKGAVDRIQKRAEAIKTLQKAKQPFRQGRSVYREKASLCTKENKTSSATASAKTVSSPTPTSREEEGKGQRKGSRGEPQQTLPTSTLRTYKHTFSPYNPT